MGTRASILIGKADRPEGDDTLYRHCDGYPEGVRYELDHICEQCRTGATLRQLRDVGDAPINTGPREREDSLPGDIEYVHFVDIERAEWTSLELDVGWDKGRSQRVKDAVDAWRQEIKDGHIPVDGWNAPHPPPPLVQARIASKSR